jgi:hypothetical protein
MEIFSKKYIRKISYSLFDASDIYKYYSVLWIEWQDGIAYRKPVGRIEEKTWEREATEWIEI